jgi:hypothetical protein
VDGNAYSVPWRLIGERVRVLVGSSEIRVQHAGREVAVHAALGGRRGRRMDPAHLAGIVGAARPPAAEGVTAEATSPLLRPLAEYAAAVGGDF